MSKEKALIIFTVAIDVIGLGIIIPVLPVYVESFGLSALAVTSLFSVYSLFSFLSAPLLGALSDKIGRRPVMIASIFSTSLGWLIFALGKSLPILMLGRVIDGLAAGNISTAQSSIADISKDAKERAGNLGVIGMIFGLGFIVGPIIGGFLGHYNHALPFWFVGVLAMINAILAYFFLPETNKHIDRNKVVRWNPFVPLVKAIHNRTLRTLYIVWFMFNLIAVGANSIFALYLGTSFGFTPLVTGLFFTGVGLLLALNQGYLVRNIWLRNFKEKQLIMLMISFFAVGFLLMSLHVLALFIVGMIFSALGQSTLNVAMTSEIVGEADVKERGETVGVLTAIASLANIVAPLGAGLAFQYRENLAYQLASIVSVIALVILNKARVKEKHNAESDILAKEVII